MLVIGPGTGLGESSLLPAPYKDDDVRYYVWPGVTINQKLLFLLLLNRKADTVTHLNNIILIKFINKAIYSPMT